MTRATEGGLRPNALGIGAITFFVMSAAGPLVTMAGGVPVSMLLGNGAGIPGMFVVSLAILSVFAAGFTAMSQFVKSAGGFYALAAHGLGGYAAGSTATVAVFSYTAIQVGLYGLFGSAASALVTQHFGLNLDWWIYSLVALAVIGILGYRQIDLSVGVLSVLVLCECLVVLILDVVILGRQTGNMGATPFTPAVIASGSPSIGLLFCFSAFIGFEGTIIYAEEAREPERAIPLATYLSLFVIGGFYVFSSWCMVLGVGVSQLPKMLAALPDVTIVLFQMSDQYVGKWLTLTMRMLFLTSIFAGMLAFHNSIARYLFAMGREHLISRAFGDTHGRYQSPHRGSLLQTTMGGALVLVFATAHADPILVVFARATAVGTLGVVALMVIASAAIVRYFIGRPGNIWRVRIFPVIATGGLGCVLALGCLRFATLAGGGSPVVLWLPGLLATAALMGVTMADRVRRSNDQWFRQLGRMEH